MYTQRTLQRRDMNNRNSPHNKHQNDLSQNNDCDQQPVKQAANKLFKGKIDQADI